MRVHELECVALQELARTVAEQSLHGGTRVLEGAVFPDDRHDVEGVLDERAKMLFAAPQRFLGGGAVDRGGEHARRRLQEVDVVAPGSAPPRAVRAPGARPPPPAPGDEAPSPPPTRHPPGGGPAPTRFRP